MSSPRIGDFIASKKLSKRHTKASSSTIYKSGLEQFQAFLNGFEEQRPIWTADGREIRLFLADHNSPMSVISPIREYFRYLQDEHLRDDNPTLGIQLPKAPRQNPALLILSRSEVSRLQEAPIGPLSTRDKAIIHLLCCGLKRAECVSLLLRDVELERQRIKLPKRHMLLNPQAAAALKTYLEAQTGDKRRPLFPGRRDAPMSHRQMWQIVKNYVVQCGLDEKASPETLRATFAVHAMEDGISYLSLIDALGTFNDDWLRNITAIARSRIEAGRDRDRNAGLSARNLAELLKVHNFPAVHEEFERALETVSAKPREAVSAASNILEAVCKQYVADNNLEPSSRFDLASVFSIVRKDLGFDPASIEDDDLKRVLGGLFNIVDALGALRTHASSAHAQGTSHRRYQLTPRDARIAVSAAHAVVSFIIETWMEKQRTGSATRI